MKLYLCPNMHKDNWTHADEAPICPVCGAKMDAVPAGSIVLVLSYDPFAPVTAEQGAIQPESAVEQ